MGYVHGFGEWIAAVLEHWHGWVSGSVIAFALEIGEKVWKFEVPRKLFIWILGLGLLWSVFAAWRDEHMNTEAVIEEKAHVSSQYNQCDKERAVQSALAQRYSADLASEQLQISNQQDTFNRCILAMGQTNLPTPTKIQVVRWSIPGEIAINGTKGRMWVLVALTNKTFSSTKGTMKCDGAFVPIEATLLTQGEALRADFRPINEQSAHVEFMYPPWSYRNPLVLAAYTELGHDIHSCAFTMD